MIVNDSTIDVTSGPTYLLILTLRITGIIITQNTRNYDSNWKEKLGIFINILTFLGLVSLLITIFVSLIFNLESKFTRIGLCLWLFNITISYSLISLNMRSQYNIIDLIQDIISSNKIINIIKRPMFHVTSTKQLLRMMLTKWLLIGCTFFILNYSFIFVAFGSKPHKHFIPVGDNNGWYLIHILFTVINIHWVLPMVIIKVICNLLYERIVIIVDYLEHYDEYDSKLAINIVSLMEYYDYIYYLNNRVISLIGQLVTCNCVLLTTQIMFTLQVYIYIC
jgi:hypothetical protein